MSQDQQDGILSTRPSVAPNQVSNEVSTMTNKQILYAGLNFTNNDYLAGFWLRFLANFIDGIFNLIFLVLVLVIFSVVVAAMEHSGSLSFVDYENGVDAFVDNYIYLISLGYIGFYALIYGLLESSGWQASFGKKICGIIVIGSTGEKISFGDSFLRNFIKYALLNLFAIIMVIVAFTKKKQAPQDFIKDSYVIRKRYLNNVLEDNKEFIALKNQA